MTAEGRGGAELDSNMTTTTTPTFPAIWYTSGTPINTGQRNCAMERYLGYSAGRHGTGWRKRAVAVPLATGSAVHTGVQLIGEWLIEWQAKGGGGGLWRKLQIDDQLDEVIAWAAAEAAAGYAATARARGLELTKTDLDAAAAVEQLIVEQATLIESQVWIYALGRLPIMLAEYRPLCVEYDESPVVDCTCGLGDWVADSATHAARGCAGICLQAKADFIWEHVATGKLVYEEFKTKATENYGWEMAWEHSGQLLLNMEAASRRLGKDVSEAFVPVLFKGKRDRLVWGDQNSPKIQQSPLVYGWYDPGNGMTRPAEWSAQYEWYDDWGKKHRLGGSFKRKGIWIADEPLPETNPNGAVIRAGASRVEHWVKGWVLAGQYPKLLKVLGPFPKPRARVPDAVQSLLAEERRWRADVDQLREWGVFNATDHGTGDAEPYGAADLISRSWQCTKFDGTPCAFKPVCHREPGSERGIEHLEQFEIRTPHHEVEKLAMTETITRLGLTWPQDDDEDSGDGN